jgi:hypothetical protein
MSVSDLNANIESCQKSIDQMNAVQKSNQVLLDEVYNNLADESVKSSTCVDNPSCQAGWFLASHENCKVGKKGICKRTKAQINRELEQKLTTYTRPINISCCDDKGDIQMGEVSKYIQRGNECISKTKQQIEEANATEKQQADAQAAILAKQQADAQAAAQATEQKQKEDKAKQNQTNMGIAIVIVVCVCIFSSIIMFLFRGKSENAPNMSSSVSSSVPSSVPSSYSMPPPPMGPPPMYGGPAYPPMYRRY